MPSITVNDSSMVALTVIHFLCTLALTIGRHFCSKFEHKFRRADGRNPYLSLSTGPDFGAVNLIATK